MSELLSVQKALIPFLTLAALEIVLGVDNVVFIAILSEKVPKRLRAAVRRVGLALAALGRAVLLLAIAWVITLEETTFAIFGYDTNAKNVILILGGVFLIGKATWEIHHSLEGPKHEAHETDASPAKAVAKTTGSAFMLVLGQIFLLDLVFSIDSVLTAVGMVRPADYSSAPFPLTNIPWVPLTIMIAAIFVAIAVMLIFIGPISRFIQQHPTMKMLALSFLLLVGVVLAAEGFEQHIDRRYIYFAMGFSLFVELLNLRIVSRAKRKARASAQSD